MPDRVEVKWLDSGLHLDKGWAARETYLEKPVLDNMTVYTVGWLMHEDEEAMLIALSYDPANDTYFSVQVIARQNILGTQII